MPIKDIRNSVRWVRSFVMKDVGGESPDVRHAELHRLAHLVVQSIPITFSDQAENYQNKLEQIKDCYIKKLNLAMQPENAIKERDEYEENYSYLIKIIFLLKKAVNLANKIESNDSSEDYELDQQEKEELHEDLLNLGCSWVQDDEYGEDSALCKAEEKLKEYEKELEIIENDKNSIDKEIKKYIKNIKKQKKILLRCAMT